MREAKTVKLAVSTDQPSASITEPELSTSTADEDERRPRDQDDSENEMPNYSSSDDDEFDPQQILDDWVTGLRLYEPKMLSVLLSLTFQKRFQVKATHAALESAWITGFNEIDSMLLQR